MTFLGLRIELPRALVDTVSGRLFAMGASGVEETYRAGETPKPRQPWDPPGMKVEDPQWRVVRGWFEDPDQAAVVADVRATLGHRADMCTFAWEAAPEIDWESEWKKGFPVLEISPRITICPPWDLRDGALVVEPGQGFGTGQHPTTRYALRALDAVVGSGGIRTALDVGCGSGILAIAAARLGLEARGFDVEEPAIRDAHANAALNGLVVPFRVGRIEDEGPADLVLANLHAELLVQLDAQLLRVCRHTLICAGVMIEKEDRVRACFDPHLELIERESDGEWVGLTYRVKRA